VFSLPYMLSSGTGMLYLWRNSSFRILILIAAGHLIKGLLKFSESVSYIPLALSDPDGVSNLKALHNGQLLIPGPLLNNSTLIIMAVIILVPAIYFYRREGKISRSIRK
ncbi:MAG: hypothetical protein ACM3Q2_01790, partial [Syntrophothermus sp.]